MRKYFITLLILIAPTPLLAQGVGGMPERPDATTLRPAEVKHTVNFESKHGETFTVFIDGLPVNRMPQTRVMAAEVSSQEHEVVVVSKRPAERAAVLNLRPGERNVDVGVNYDASADRLFLYTAAANRGRNRNDYDISSNPTQGEATGVPDPQPATRHEFTAADTVSEDGLTLMLLDMRAKTFSDDRLALGKALVAASPMRADQIARLAATLDFSTTQTDFLKYAYDYCTDPENYRVAVDVLTFSSDRKKVLDYIATR